MLGAVVRGERQLDRARLAGARSEQTLLEPGDQVAAAELHELVAALATLERDRRLPRGGILRRQVADVVDDDEVALPGRPLDRIQAGQALAHRVDLLLDRLIGHHRLAARDLQALILAELGLRQHADLDRELQGLALRRQVSQVDRRIAHGHDAGLGDRVGIPARERVPDGFVEHGLAADALQDQRRGHLALAEARQFQLAPELARALLDAILDLGRRDLHLHAHARLGQLGDGGLQGGWARPPRYRAAPRWPTPAQPHRRSAWRRGCGPARSATSPAARSTSPRRSRVIYSRERVDERFARRSERPDGRRTARRRAGTTSTGQVAISIR